MSSRLPLAERQMRLAFVGPLPPDRSGIADYCAELLPALAELAEVTVYPEADAALGSGIADELGAIAGLRALDRLVDDLAAGRVERVVYQLGNSAGSHARTYRALLRIPGVVVLHEYLLHHLVRELTVVRGDEAAFAEELRYATGETGTVAARERLARGREPAPWAFPLFERVVDASEAILVHSEFTRRRILESRPLAPVDVIPLACARPPGGGDRAAARARLGIPVDVPLFASFGFVTPQKHLEPALAAFAQLRRERPQARYLIVGEVSPYYDLAAAIERAAGPGEHGITVTGRVDLDWMHDAMAACDVAVNLRHPTGGESSATLLRLLALGRAVVVSEAGSFAELPAGVVAKVAVDPGEELHLCELFRRLIGDCELRATLGANAARYAARHHRPETVARRLLAALARCERRAPSSPMPPLAPFPQEALETRLIAALATGLADLGLGEPDEAPAELLARAIVELGLDGGAATSAAAVSE